MLFSACWSILSIVRSLSACEVSRKMEPIIIVHGGAGDIPDIRVPLKIAGVKESVKIGYAILAENGTALDAVEAAVKFMEGEEAFNAGNFLHVILSYFD